MEEMKSARTIEEIQKDYATMSAKLGEKVYHLNMVNEQSASIQKEAGELVEEIRKLNQEASELKKESSNG